MSYLGMAEDELRKRGGYWAAREIEHQPDLWRAIAASVRNHSDDVLSFLDAAKTSGVERVLLVGAGSSGMAAEIVVEHIRNLGGFPDVRCVRSTELVIRPDAYLDPDVPTLLVSMSSSGSTPETVNCAREAKRRVRNLWHIIIVCVADGILVQESKGDPQTLHIPLPPDTKGKSFAATAEFTCLVAQAMMLFDCENIERYIDFFEGVAKEAKALFEAPFIHSVANDAGSAMVLLGSRELKTLAAEAALKAVEFTGGTYMSNFTSSLEFRHGPKLIMNSPVLAVFFAHPDPSVARYDLDMMTEVVGDQRPGKVACMSFGPLREGDLEPDHYYEFERREIYAHAPVAGCFLGALAMQSFIELISLEHGICADWPSEDRLVPKVANRVTVYCEEVA